MYCVTQFSFWLQCNCILIKLKTFCFCGKGQSKCELCLFNVDGLNGGVSVIGEVVVCKPVSHAIFSNICGESLEESGTYSD